MMNIDWYESGEERVLSLHFFIEGNIWLLRDAKFNRCVINGSALSIE